MDGARKSGVPRGMPAHTFQGQEKKRRMPSRVARIARALPAVLTVLLVVLTGGCTKKIPLTTMNGGNYEVVSVATEATYAERTAQPGNELLLVSVRGEEDELDDMEAAFFGESKAQVTDGPTTATCQLVVYAPQKSGGIDAILVFEVPESFGPDFTLQGDAFQAVALEATGR